MITVTELTTQYDIPRTTVLYYKRIGLRQPHHRSDNGYRWYGDQASIMAYRSYGVPVAQIAKLTRTMKESIPNPRKRIQNLRID